jgi:hypothetical protein
MGPFKDGWTKDDVAAVIARGLPDELLYVPIVVSLDTPDCAWSEAICISLSQHPQFNVRGNAILGFGHLARTCGHLDLAQVVPIVAAGLKDDHEYVRGHALDVAEDIYCYLGSQVPGYAPTDAT